MSSFSKIVLRSLDLLSVRFEFVNLILVKDRPPGGRLVRDEPGRDALIVVHFPPQHLAETVAAEESAPSVPMLGRVAGPSRLAFRLRADVNELPFTLDTLLDWTSLDPQLVPVALPARGTVFEDATTAPFPRAPTATETAIELPYRLLLSPHPGGGWAHSVQPVTHEGRTELWHTRLGVTRAGPQGSASVDEEQAEDRYVRAVFSPDMGDGPAAGVDTPPGLKFRRQIVGLSADFRLRKNDGTAYSPEPVAVDRLMLSARGGWLRARGDWDGVPTFDLSQWQHVTTLGRDHFVRTVQEGLLFPFGHRAAYIEVTERLIEERSGGRVAVLRERRFIAVREPVRTYRPEGYPHGGREMPFSQIRITTVSLPVTTEDILHTHGIFWVMSEAPAQAGPALFHMIGTDSTGAETDFHAAVIFVPQTVAELSDIFMSGISRAYRSLTGNPPSERRRIPIDGAQVVYAPPVDPLRPGDTALTTESLVFDVHIAPDGATTPPEVPFLPVLESAVVRVPAVEQITGVSEPVEVGLARAFLESGLDAAANPAQLFAEVTGPALDVALPAERGGALARLDLAARGLSRSLGPVGGDFDQLTAGRFDPSTFFADSARLLGAVRLSALLPASGDQAQLPRMVSHVTSDAVVATLDWEPKITDGADTGPLRSRPPGMSLSLHARIERPMDGGPARSSVSTTLSNFTFSFQDVLNVNFNALSFRSENGGQPVVSADLADEALVFRPPLSFLNALRALIPSDGFSDPPALEVGPSGVKVGYSLALPPVTVGVFALENVKLGASLHLPFTDGRASLRFNFAERHDEFLLTVQGLGGGGYFVIALGLDGIEMIEAALEFGASVSLDFGVASGGVSIMAGVYFHYEKVATELTGYLRMGGDVEVLGLVSVSIDMFMGLSYVRDGDGSERIYGVATVVLKIDLTLFSKSVEFTVRRSFAKGDGDPGFGDVMSEADWAAYAGALA
ncbi:hypothetical protein [Kitasatospora sp. NPDC047058]|uniref:hypothetical protein n=1 Tax=Kitasatospora sp. NPDC047058 TaxID=3155620 RepID=UPI0033CA7CF7